MHAVRAQFDGSDVRRTAKLHDDLVMTDGQTAEKEVVDVGEPPGRLMRLPLTESQNMKLPSSSTTML